MTLSISFLLGSPDISGGTYVIFEHATRLQNRGHRITIITESSIPPERYSWHPEAEKLTWLSLEEAATETFDIVIATWWKSPFLLHRLRGTHYIYFVQSIESRFFPEETPNHHDKRDLALWQQYCESTYSCNIPAITEAGWIQDYLRKNYNRTSYLVRNGIRKDLYNTRAESIAPTENGRLRVLIEGPVDVDFKNVPCSIKLAEKAGADEIWLLTSSDVSEFPGVDKIFSRIPIHETPSIYRSCDVLVKLSYIEGMFGPPLEMFHCGGTAIVYNVTGHDEYIVDGENSYVVPKDHEEMVVRLLQKLKSNVDELQRLKQGAIKTAEQWVDWEKSSEQFSQALMAVIEGPGTSRTYLKNWTKRVEEAHRTRFSDKTLQQFQKREQGEEGFNFLQIYTWSEGEGLENGSFQWIHCPSGEQAQLAIETEIRDFPFWIRIDPGVRIGIIEIFSITITSVENSTLLYNCSTPEQFDKLFIAGTLKRINCPGRNLFLSTGDDPQLILPALQQGIVNKKETVAIKIELRETSVSEFTETTLSKPQISRFRQFFAGKS